MATPAHIVILCSRLDLPGGIERAVVNTSNLFVAKGHHVSLVILDETNETYYPLDPKVNCIQLSLSFGITPEGNPVTRKIRLLGDVLKLRKLLLQLSPGIVIASEYPYAAAAVLAGARKRSKVVSWEHHHFYELKRNFFWERVFDLTYPKLHAVVCLNEDEKKLFEPVNGNPVVIPNFTQPGARPSTQDKKLILTVARLSPVKGIDLLLKAARQIFIKYPDWKWKLIGDGEGVEAVSQAIREQGLEENLILQAPAGHDLEQEYRDASLYVMTSRNECFPMTLLEAMSAGLPCIAFDCETGPRHIIRNNVNGILVEKENVMKLSEAISSLISNKEQRKTMGEEAFRSIDQFSPDMIYKRWNEKVFTL